MSASLDHLWEFLYLRLQSEPERGWQLWSEVFDQCREDWQIDLCRRLLREIKRTDLAVAQANGLILITLNPKDYAAFAGV